MGVHVVNVAIRDISATGDVIINKNATIAEVATSSKEHRIIPDTTHAPNSANHPTVKQYLISEDSSGYNLVHMDQYFIITSDA